MEYKTSDLYLAAYLSTEHYELVRTERVGSRTVFVFSGEEDMQTNLIGWAGGDAQTNAVAYADTLKRFKSLLFM